MPGIICNASGYTRTKKNPKNCNLCGLTCHSKEYLKLHLIQVH